MTFSTSLHYHYGHLLSMSPASIMPTLVSSPVIWNPYILCTLMRLLLGAQYAKTSARCDWLNFRTKGFTRPFRLVL